MSLPHAILTALLEKPSSGLELTRRFDKSIGFFWSATHQQIYRELGKLEQAGLIRALPSAERARGRRKEYEVLAAGRGELARWTASSDEPKPLRDALAVRIRAAAVVGTAGLEAELERHLAVHREQLASYLAMAERDFPRTGAQDSARGEPDSSRGERDSVRREPVSARGERDGGAEQTRLHEVLLHGGVRMETFWVEWLAEVLEAVRALDRD
ncbi:PadR family transcriptional regulator [Streptomyces sp. P38-E01]|uniref:PadR family transcriptional regulator n=1 Tax=Streptomyces tardus TaxID=2780544 RepID=A0A949JL63_9ACTN|nr:PadR family transcriptional regulator [Streptomyces tardus]MBU7597166.1 PadR family transcriptional regulator [Streptomyces tardus]